MTLEEDAYSGAPVCQPCHESCLECTGPDAAGLNGTTCLLGAAATREQWRGAGGKWCEIRNF